MQKKSLIIAYFALCFSALLPTACFGDEVYTWTDEEGRTHFSTEPGAAQAKKADLPQLDKEDIDERIKAIKERTPESCEQHGGEDCSRGPDIDGSVICLDGYRDAVLPYRFHCLETRLESRVNIFFEGSEEPEQLTNENLRTLSRRAVSEIRITVRNTTAVPARKVLVIAKVGDFTVRDLPTVGPEEVEPFGLADYTVALASESRPLNVNELRSLRVRIRCENCR